MARKTAMAPAAWERVLVRHVMPSRRDDIGRLRPLLHVPFDTSSSSTASGGRQDTQIFGQASGRWMLVAHFADQDWGVLFTNSGTAAELFEGNAKNPRMEVAWVGFREDEGGWFIRLRSKGKVILDFSQPDGGESEPKFQGVDLSDDFLAGSSTGAESFQRLCEHFGIAAQQRTIEVVQNKFQIMGLRGKPVTTGLKGYLLYHGPQIAEKENAASDRLAKAIDRCDADGVRKAIQAGASLEHLPDTSISPLMSALFRCPQTGWEACAEVLIELGAPVNGWPNSAPPVVDATQNFVNETQSLAILKLLVKHGADVNAPGENGGLALFNAVVYRRHATIQFLLEHGADPHAKTAQGATIVEWVHSRIQDDQRSGFSQYAEILTLLTGEEVEQPGLLALTDELKRENQRFEECLLARKLLKVLSSETKTVRMNRDFLREFNNYKNLSQELAECGFIKAGAFEIHLGQLPTFATAFVNEEAGFDALLTPSEAQSGQLRLEIGATSTDGNVVSVANEKASELLSFRPSFLNCETIAGASVQELTGRLTETIQSQRLKVRSFESSAFEERISGFNQRLIQEIRDYLTNLLTTPAILVDGRPARFERLGCFLDIVSKDNPAWSTAKIAEGMIKDLDRAEAANSSDSWQLQQGINAAAYLLAMQHLELAGAPTDDDFISRGASIAVRYFQAESRRSKPFANDWVVDELLYGLLLNMLSSHWDNVGKICEALKPGLATSKVRMSDDPPREMAKFLLILASRFRKKPIRGIDAMVEDIRKSRRQHPKLLLKAWEAIEGRNPSAYEKALRDSLDFLLKDHPEATSFYELRRFLAWPESLLVQIAAREGLSSPKLPANLADRLLVMPE